MSEISESIRKNFGDTDRKRDEGLKTPESVVRIDDIAYGSDPAWQVLDVYRPESAGGEKLPVIVSVHGGGWVYGTKENYQYYCMSLAERGFAVVNFSYRLAPEHKFPAALEDTCMVFSWVLAHAEKYGFDPERIFAAGDSAGGHTLALFCAMCANPEYRKHFSFSPPAGFIPAAIALNCAVFKIQVSERPEDKFSTDLMSDYLEHKGSAEELPFVNVPEWITDKFPQTFLMTAEEDFLKYQLPDVLLKMLEKNVAFTARYYKASKERLGHVFHLDIRNEYAKQCNDEECAYFLCRDN
ncbi:MAG: alpha/beta hydrolase [Lachnospiraceae bacterium]|nr:alpha/beta hydrolase [Lachnospiraceae bacterium]